MINLSIRICPVCRRRRLIKYEPSACPEDGFYFCLYCGRLYEFHDIEITSQDYFEFGIEEFDKIHKAKERFDRKCLE